MVYTKAQSTRGVIWDSRVHYAPPYKPTILVNNTLNDFTQTV